MSTPRTQFDTEAIRLGSLSLRQIDVSVLVTRGLTDKQVGEELGISCVRVSHYLTEIFRKLDISSRSELISFGSRHNLAVPSCTTNASTEGRSSGEPHG